jgi:hypothetical protein
MSCHRFSCCSPPHQQPMSGPDGSAGGHIADLLLLLLDRTEMRVNSWHEEADSFVEGLYPLLHDPTLIFRAVVLSPPNVDEASWVGSHRASHTHGLAHKWGLMPQESSGLRLPR